MDQLGPPKPQQTPPRRVSIFRRRVVIVIAAGLGSLLLASPVLLRIFIIEAFKIPSGAMIPTLQVGDHLFVDKLAYRFKKPKAGEVIVFKYPVDPTKDFIKRVVAVEGDALELRGPGESLFINGEQVKQERLGQVHYEHVSDDVPPKIEDKVAEEFRETLGGKQHSIYHSPELRGVSCRMGAHFGCAGPVRVPPGHIFVMGDNRDNAYDSRFWGFVPNELVKGRAMVIWMSQRPTGGTRPERAWKKVE